VRSNQLNEALEDWNRDLIRESVRMGIQAFKDASQSMAQTVVTASNATVFALTPEIAAKKARCSRSTIERAISAGKILAVKGSTGLLSLDRDSFEKWTQARVPTCSKLKEPPRV
jgi:hypothetical protein